MKEKRIGNDINVRWQVFQGDMPFMLEGKDVKLYLRTPYAKVKAHDYTIVDNEVRWTFYGKDQTNIGKYSLVLVVNEDKEGMVTTDACDFVKLVACSCKIGGMDDKNVTTESIELISHIDFGQGGSGIKQTMTPVLYDELVQLRNDGQLVPGTYYRIMDYETTTVQADTQSAGNLFDVVVLALSENELSEQAHAVHSERDTEGYFADSNLSAWQIWYCLDNDTTRFAWADAESGKGVIYRMIDEFDNDCPYDFKNVQYKRRINTEEGYPQFSEDAEEAWVYTFCANSYHINNDEWSELKDGSLESPYGHMSDEETSTFHHNVMKSWIVIFDSDEVREDYGKAYLNGNVFLGWWEEIGSANAEDAPYYYAHCCNSNNMGIDCRFNSLGNDCRWNSLGNDCRFNSLGNDCRWNSLGNNCYSNQFDEACNNNSLDNSCHDNAFNIYCSSNNFGNGCGDNILGDSSSYNILGLDCNSNILDYDCSFNNFGSSCEFNSFGRNCSSNNFGSYCSSNNFDSNCCSNSFGSYCSFNNFGSSCEFNSFGINCSSNNFEDNGKGDGRRPAHNVEYCRLEDGVHDMTIYIEARAREYSYMRYMHIYRGVSDDEIYPPYDVDHEICYARNSDDNIIHFVLADLAAS